MVATISITASSLTRALVLAQQDGGAEGPSLFQLVMPFMMIVALYYVMFVLPQRSRNQRLNDLAASLKENDHIVTSSGIYGVVTNVQRDVGRVTLRIDESTGAKMKVTIDAISQVLDDDKNKPKADAKSGK